MVRKSNLTWKNKSYDHRLKTLNLKHSSRRISPILYKISKNKGYGHINNGSVYFEKLYYILSDIASDKQIANFTKDISACGYYWLLFTNTNASSKTLNRFVYSTFETNRSLDAAILYRLLLNEKLSDDAFVYAFEKYVKFCNIDDGYRSAAISEVLIKRHHLIDIKKYPDIANQLMKLSCA